MHFLDKRFLVFQVLMNNTDTKSPANQWNHLEVCGSVHLIVIGLSHWRTPFSQLAWIMANTKYQSSRPKIVATKFLWTSWLTNWLAESGVVRLVAAKRTKKCWQSDIYIVQFLTEPHLTLPTFSHISNILCKMTWCALCCVTWSSRS